MLRDNKLVKFYVTQDFLSLFLIILWISFKIYGS